jgi:translation elongation factor P/translation initiation factor 5A
LTDLAPWGHLPAGETARHGESLMAKISGVRPGQQFQFLYKQGDQLTFMDTMTYDQIEFREDFAGERSTLLISTDEVGYVRRAD